MSRDPRQAGLVGGTFLTDISLNTLSRCAIMCQRYYLRARFGSAHSWSAVNACCSSCLLVKAESAAAACRISKLPPRLSELYSQTCPTTSSPIAYDHSLTLALFKSSLITRMSHQCHTGSRVRS
jgi:hypothetical protein